MNTPNPNVADLFRFLYPRRLGFATEEEDRQWQMSCIRELSQFLKRQGLEDSHDSLALLREELGFAPPADETPAARKERWENLYEMLEFCPTCCGSGQVFTREREYKPCPTCEGEGLPIHIKIITTIGNIL